MSPTAPHSRDLVTAVAGRRARTRGTSPRRPGASTRRRIAERLLVAALTALVLTVVLSQMGGTYAYWSEEATVDAGTLTTGTAALTAHGEPGPVSGLKPGEEGLLPGDEVPWTVTLENTGDVRLEISVTATGTIAGVTQPVDVVLDDADSALLLEPGTEASRTLSLIVIAPDSLLPGETMDITLLFEGVQR
ncbi:hypothetical protein CFK39_06340 [Brachybacterium avium]|uniref:Uncharacterized protein n=1 Tax=Brachybacterium avium TaxID=2017485 RepID=A0A220UCR4_9MICO|nr:hypothetical protein [Brachybacterium avium]ASK65513.1 hypothetical protein CFK39_06340 [Brachybacterium avium]